MRVYKINWDTDGEDVKSLGIPLYIELPEDFEGDIANYLSDEYGWCVDSLEETEYETLDDVWN